MSYKRIMKLHKEMESLKEQQVINVLIIQANGAGYEYIADGVEVSEAELDAMLETHTVEVKIFVDDFNKD